MILNCSSSFKEIIIDELRDSLASRYVMSIYYSFCSYHGTILIFLIGNIKNLTEASTQIFIKRFDSLKMNFHLPH